eukprot:366575-Chlamydomonas_euryale.AAC.4
MHGAHSIARLTVDAGRRVVLDAQVDVLLDAEAKVARVGEVLPDQLKLLHLEAGLLRTTSEEPVGRAGYRATGCEGLTKKRRLRIG